LKANGAASEDACSVNINKRRRRYPHGPEVLPPSRRRKIPRRLKRSRFVQATRSGRVPSQASEGKAGMLIAFTLSRIVPNEGNDPPLSCAGLEAFMPEPVMFEIVGLAG